MVFCFYESTGGPFAAHHLAEEYYGQFIAVPPNRAGMKAVFASSATSRNWIAERPANRDYLMNIPAGRFIAQMKHWQSFYEGGADLPVIGATAAELASIEAPTCVIAGNDRTHPRELAFTFAQLLPNAIAHDVMGAQCDIIRTPPEAWDEKMDEIGTIFIDFLSRVEANVLRA